mmetsp:Transcript_104444/g.185730  ORF Transcript_104444/g.185730 Transcript_104444/m.185730 type:complete len:1361 (+) Transcript_104444:3632-7714(+)
MEQQLNIAQKEMEEEEEGAEEPDSPLLHPESSTMQAFEKLKPGGDMIIGLAKGLAVGGTPGVQGGVGTKEHLANFQRNRRAAFVETGADAMAGVAAGMVHKAGRGPEVEAVGPGATPSTAVSQTVNTATQHQMMKLKMTARLNRFKAASKQVVQLNSAPNVAINSAAAPSLADLRRLQQVLPIWRKASAVVRKAMESARKEAQLDDENLLASREDEFHVIILGYVSELLVHANLPQKKDTKLAAVLSMLKQKHLRLRVCEHVFKILDMPLQDQKSNLKLLSLGHISSESSLRRGAERTENGDMEEESMRVFGLASLLGQRLYELKQDMWPADVSAITLYEMAAQAIQKDAINGTDGTEDEEATEAGAIKQAVDFKNMRARLIAKSAVQGSGEADQKDLELDVHGQDFSKLQPQEADATLKESAAKKALKQNLLAKSALLPSDSQRKLAAARRAGQPPEGGELPSDAKQSHSNVLPVIPPPKWKDSEDDNHSETSLSSDNGDSPTFTRTSSFPRNVVKPKRSISQNHSKDHSELSDAAKQGKTDYKRRSSKLPTKHEGDYWQSMKEFVQKRKEEIYEAQVERRRQENEEEPGADETEHEEIQQDGHIQYKALQARLNQVAKANVAKSVLAGLIQPGATGGQDSLSGKIRTELLRQAIADGMEVESAAQEKKKRLRNAKSHASLLNLTDTSTPTGKNDGGGAAHRKFLLGLSEEDSSATGDHEGNDEVSDEQVSSRKLTQSPTTALEDGSGKGGAIGKDELPLELASEGSRSPRRRSVEKQPDSPSKRRARRASDTSSSEPPESLGLTGAGLGDHAMKGGRPRPEGSMVIRPSIANSHHIKLQVSDETVNTSHRRLSALHQISVSDDEPGENLQDLSQAITALAEIEHRKSATRGSVVSAFKRSSRRPSSAPQRGLIEEDLETLLVVPGAHILKPGRREASPSEPLTPLTVKGLRARRHLTSRSLPGSPRHSRSPSPEQLCRGMAITHNLKRRAVSPLTNELAAATMTVWAYGVETQSWPATNETEAVFEAVTPGATKLLSAPAGWTPVHAKKQDHKQRVLAPAPPQASRSLVQAPATNEAIEDEQMHASAAPLRLSWRETPASLPRSPSAHALDVLSGKEEKAAPAPAAEKPSILPHEMAQIPLEEAQIRLRENLMLFKRSQPVAGPTVDYHAYGPQENQETEGVKYPLPPPPGIFFKIPPPAPSPRTARQAKPMQVAPAEAKPRLQASPRLPPMNQGAPGVSPLGQLDAAAKVPMKGSHLRPESVDVSSRARAILSYMDGFDTMELDRLLASRPGTGAKPRTPRSPRKLHGGSTLPQIAANGDHLSGLTPQAAEWAKHIEQRFGSTVPKAELGERQRGRR